MNREYIYLVILGMTLVTFLEKALPICFLSDLKLSPFAKRWLDYMPSAVLAALLLPSVLLAKGEMGDSILNLNLNNFILIASIPAFILAYTRRSFFGSIALGMVIVASLKFIA